MTPSDLWPLLRPLLFRVPPETAHDLALGVLAGWSRVFAGRVAAASPARDPALTVEAMGLRFPNPISAYGGHRLWARDKAGAARSQQAGRPMRSFGELAWR